MWCVCVWNYRRFASLDLTAFWRGGPMHRAMTFDRHKVVMDITFAAWREVNIEFAELLFLVKLWMLGFGFDMSERMSEDMSESMSKDMSERMPERISEDMSERMSKDMSERCQKDYRKICQKECQQICQKECQKIYQKICQKECQKICQKERQSQSAKSISRKEHRDQSPSH